MARLSIKCLLTPLSVAICLFLLGTEQGRLTVCNEQCGHGPTSLAHLRLASTRVTLVLCTAQFAFRPVPLPRSILCRCVTKLRQPPAALANA